MALWLVWQTLYGTGLFPAVISFMLFGLLMALAWVRLEAPDVALAEAAIGAGVTGALLLATLGRLTREEQPGEALPQRLRDTVYWLPGGAVMFMLFVAAAWQLPAPGLSDQVHAELGASGADNPVTAVLLNFRAFDTLLEIGVLFLGMLVIWSLGPTGRHITAHIPYAGLPALGRTLFPAFVLVSFYLLWRGSHAPGGAFPAGAVMGAGGVLMLLAGARPWLTRSTPWRVLLGAGVGGMLLVAFFVMVAGYSFFEFPQGLAGLLVLSLELVAGLSIPLLLFALYLGGQPPDHWKRDFD